MNTKRVLNPVFGSDTNAAAPWKLLREYVNLSIGSSTKVTQEYTFRSYVQ
jgi:hypothetical protein